MSAHTEIFVVSPELHGLSRRVRGGSSPNFRATQQENVV